MNEQTIFTEALERSDIRDRCAFLDQACEGNPSLRARIERLLAQHDHVGGFLEAASFAVSGAPNYPATEQRGTVIGSYKLLEQIGEGGFGVVYRAEQSQPVQRLVALKILKP